MSSPAWAGYGSFVATREAALGLTRVDNGDGTFHYALPSGASWTIPDCNGDSVGDDDDDILLWNGENRVAFNPASTSAPDDQKALMIIKGPNGACSGVRISEWWVLTAAHCVTRDSSGEEFSGSQLQICSDTSDTFCLPGGRVRRPAAWTGADTGAYRHDYALVSIASSTAPSDPIMVLSSDTRSETKKRTPKHVGYPDRKGLSSGTCTNTWLSDAHEHPAAEVKGTRNGLLRLRADTSAGASGGPWYFMSGGAGRIVGLQSGYNRHSSLSGWVGGPRVQDFKNWVIVTTGNR